MRLRGLAWRAHNPRWAFDPVSGDGAARYGGRCNPIGTPALYLSRRMETAWREAQQGFAFKAQPLTICAYRLDCADVADLTDPATRAEHGVDPAELACAWEDLATQGREPPSWTLARRLIAAGSRRSSCRASRPAPCRPITISYFGAGPRRRIVSR